MVGWHHRVKGHEFEQTPEDTEGQGRLACCLGIRGVTKSRTGQRLNNNRLKRSRGNISD